MRQARLAGALFLAATLLAGCGGDQTGASAPENAQASAALADKANAPSRSAQLLERSTSYARWMMSNGRDRYNTSSRLFASQLDRTTGSLPAERLPSLEEFGVRDMDRSWFGSNVMHDQQLYTLLFELSSSTGDSAYAREAERSLRWFFQNTQSRATWLYPMGEHLSWDLVTEDTVKQTQNDQVHEFFEYFDYWSVCRRHFPGRCRAYALGLWRHQIADQSTGEFSRHARYDTHGTAKGAEFPRHAGFYVRTWAEAVANTPRRNPARNELKLAIETLRETFAARRSDIGLVPMGMGERKGLSETSVTSQSLSQALDYHRAAALIGNNMGVPLRDYAQDNDAALLRLPHLSATRPEGFVQFAHLATGHPSDPRGESIESLGNPGTFLVYPLAARAGSDSWIESDPSKGRTGSVGDALVSPDDDAGFISTDETGAQEEFDVGEIAFNGNQPAKVTMLVRGRRDTRAFYRPYLRVGGAIYYADTDEKLNDIWQSKIFEWPTNPATNQPWKTTDFNASPGGVSFGIEARQLGKAGIARITQMLVGIQLDSVAYTPMWDAGYGVVSTAEMAVLMFERYQQTGNTAYRDLAIRAAELYLAGSAPPNLTYLPKLHADIIGLMMHAWRETGEARFLDGADRYASEAEGLFLDDTSPLPKVASQASWYETITGGDDLMLQIYYLSRALYSAGL